MSELYIGLMSGTSMDAIDAALVDFSSGQPDLKHHLCLPIANQLKEELLRLCAPAHDEIRHMAHLDIQMGELFAQAANQLLAQAGVSKMQIRAIGSHGQTIRHLPQYGSSLQIADPNRIAYLTGIETVADFRRMDMAAGGQGAPLAPAFHHAFFHCVEENRVVLNIGGISNITLLPKDSRLVSGFDTGPGNILLDAWIRKIRSCTHDEAGAWSARGQVIPSLLAQLMAHPYFTLATPKSTGRETFNLCWLEGQLTEHADLAPEDVQRTLVEFTVASIALGIEQSAVQSGRLVVCGGGAHNDFLMQRLTDTVKNFQVCKSDLLGINGDQLEAMAFAWLARQRLLKKPGNLHSVTGASGPVILGGTYLP